MLRNRGVDRRAFLRNAGWTALAGAVGTGTSVAVSKTGTALETPDTAYDFDEVYDRIGTNSNKWDRQIGTYGEENIQVGMGIADMEFRAAPCITRALAERCSHENWGYIDTTAPYIDAIVAWNKRRYGLEIDPESVALSNGVHSALIASLKAFSPPGSKVLMSSPIYSAFYSTDLIRSKTHPAESPMKLVDGRYSIDFDDLESRIDVDTHSLILCNPQNPTGNCWSEEDLLRLGRLCLERRVVVLADEIHCDFVMKGQKYTPFASLPDKDVVDNSVTFKAASKSFSLAAMKSAWLFSTNPDYLAKVQEHNFAATNTLGMVANQAALTEGDDWLDEVVTYIDGNHDFVEAYIRDNMPLVDYTKAQGTYLAWLDVSRVVDRIGAKEQAAEESETSETPVTPETIMQRWFVENAKVHMNAGSPYGTGGAGHMRMNVAASRKLVKLALGNMAEALDKL